MRCLLACSLLFLAAASAQIAGPRSLHSLNFLLGVWTVANPGQQEQTTEFHWVERQGNTILLGRHWAGDENGCPWCVTQAAMVAYHDIASNQVHVRFGDANQQVADFRLVSAGENSAQFFTEDPGSPTYRLTFNLLPADVLLVTLDQAEPDRESDFYTVARWTFHRRPLLRRP